MNSKISLDVINFLNTLTSANELFLNEISKLHDPEVGHELLPNIY